MKDLKRCISTGGLLYLSVGGTYKVQQTLANGKYLIQGDDGHRREYPPFLFVDFITQSPDLPPERYTRGASVEGFLIMLSNDLVEQGYMPSAPFSTQTSEIMASRLLELLINARVMKVNLPAAVRTLLETR